MTDQQYGFVLHLMDGKNATAAYRNNYDCAESSDRTVWAEASKLRSNPKVAQWIEAIQRDRLSKGSVTLDSHLADLAVLRDLSIAKGAMGAAARCEELRGVRAGIGNQGDSAFAKATVMQLFDMLRRALGPGPESEAVLEALAARHGVMLPSDSEAPLIEHQPMNGTA
ncbi:MAG: hypothetical protein ACR2RE_14660 [Geminicoccaceae bacterium]